MQAVWPSLSLGWADVGLVAARAVWLAGLFSCAGTLLFAAQEGAPEVRRLALGGFGLAGVGWLAWVAAQTASFAGAWSVAALPDVLGGTLFGQVALAQLALLAGSCVVRGWPAAALALAAVAAQVGHLHAWAMERGPGFLTVAALLHLVGAASWLGGLLPLRRTIGRAMPVHAAAAARRFSRRATLYVALVAVGALAQGWTLLGGSGGLFGTFYGWVALSKALLFGTLLALAARSRWRLTPGLARPDPAPARAALLRAVAWETALGVAVVLAASLLSALQPGMDMATDSGDLHLSVRG